MADVTIINAPPQVQNASASGQQAPTATTPSSLPAGSTVSGTIIGKDPGGNFILRTDQGTIALKSSTPLTYNSDVTIRISSSNAGGTGARIVSVNGTPFSEFSAAEEPTSDSVSASLLTPTAAPATETADENTALPPGTIRAVITSAPVADSNATPSSSATGNTPQLVSGTSVTLRISDAPQNVTQQAVAGTSGTTQTGASTTAPTSSSTAQAQAASQELAQVETPANVSQVVAPQAAQIQQNTPANTVANVTTVQEPPADAASANVPSPVTPSNAASAPAASTATANTTAQMPASTGNTAGSPSPAVATSTPEAAQTPAETPAPQTSATSSAQYAAYAKQSAAEPATPTPSATTPSTAGTAAAPPAPIQAQVVSTSPNGTITLQTPLGTLTAKADAASLPATLTAGTNITIETPEAAVLSTVLTPASFSSAPASLSELSTSWSTLKDIAGVVNSANAPTANTASVLERLPQLGPEFISTSLAFIAAAMQGDSRRILGDDTVDSLRDSNRTDLLEKFNGELNNLSQAFNPPAQKEMPSWQPLLLPFVYHEELQQARLYIKRDAPKKERGASGKSTNDTRFIVEVDLSELGPLQMDGLVRTKEQTTAFDLVIRSHGAFPKKDQAEIQTIYAQTAEMTGFKGSLSFQVVREFTVKPLEEVAAAGAQSITV